MMVPRIPGEHVSFFVHGLPETKGSFIGLGSGRVKADNPRESAWGASVAWAAKIAMRGRAVLPGALVTFDFYLPRPVGNKNKRDVDKLCRSCLDAMTKIVYEDDENVQHVIASKEVAPTPGVELHVFPPIRVRASQLIACWIARAAELGIAPAL